MNYAKRRGIPHCGVYKDKALSVVNGIGIEEHDNEGRVITLEYKNSFLVNAYSQCPKGPGKVGRMKWEDDFRNYLVELDKKSLLLYGDMNVAHKEIDLRTRHQTEEMQVLPMKKGKSLPDFLKQALLTALDFSIPTKDSYTWWHTCLMPVLEMRMENRLFL